MRQSVIDLPTGQQTRIGSDGLPVIVQGPWSRDKLHFVRTFMALFNGGMKYHWETRIYVDLFAGPGLCLDEATNQEFEGSPLLALGSKTPFSGLFLNDTNREFITALQARQRRLFQMQILTTRTWIATAPPRQSADAYPTTHSFLCLLTRGPTKWPSIV